MNAADQIAPPRISFLMPMYNGLAFTRECLRTLAETTDLAHHEVILINDASTDGTAEFLDKLSGPYRALHNPERLSYAAGMNRGAELARGEILCLLNNDLVFAPNWLAPMLKALEQFPNAGFVGNVQKNPATGAYDHMGIVFDEMGRPYHFGKYFRFRPFNGVTEWQAVTAACCLIRKQVFFDAGVFDENYKNGCEDTDLCLRLGAMGFHHYVANASVIGHHVSSSEGRHDFNSQNERRRFAANYALRFSTQPWRYNGRKLARALGTLLKCGR
jgi:GT2 family glycosyltransferase